MNKPKKSLRVREITAWHSAGFSPHAGPHVRTHQCEHSLFIHVWTFGAGPQCGTRTADPHARTRQCECTFSHKALTNFSRQLQTEAEVTVQWFFDNAMEANSSKFQGLKWKRPHLDKSILRTMVPIYGINCQSI